ncbi:hypothetical protein Desor_3182 [Desulfosporosinus orientis DSM 765]|uniref:Uncharacterized protein n=1 Tax=Desulfosporosinus orientis (strain ATCC 19365 / DSM 765 / NCIMB 8382 / VKM B-1628 / Singapore I) TaxID=768706 RepID=G7W945_DESOD|nr:hypothetical protein [Desulfosporosinus orientis]AET68686.1 hypothetical protein Desor_3182 [Desulfosporosinus orientis DSM 765]
MVWLDVDQPTKKCTLHMNGSCSYLQEKRETLYKGIGDLKRDGGWLSFSDPKLAKSYYQINWPDYQFIDHC